MESKCLIMEITYFDLKPLFKGIYKREVLMHPEKLIQV